MLIDGDGKNRFADDGSTSENDAIAVSRLRIDFARRSAVVGDVHRRIVRLVVAKTKHFRADVRNSNSFRHDGESYQIRALLERGLNTIDYFYCTYAVDTCIVNGWQSFFPDTNS